MTAFLIALGVIALGALAWTGVSLAAAGWYWMMADLVRINPAEARRRQAAPPWHVRLADAIDARLSGGDR